MSPAHAQDDPWGILNMVRVLVPDFHIKGHRALCHILMCLLYCVAAGRKDGEQLERFWALFGLIATIVRVSSPGRYVDLLTHVASYLNRKKIDGLAVAVLRCFGAEMDKAKKANKELQALLQEHGVTEEDTRQWVSELIQEAGV